MSAPAPEAPAVERSVWVVAYGDEVHVYAEADEQAAHTLHLVGVAATGDGEIRKVPAGKWAQVREALRSRGVPVVDHR